MLEYTNIPPYIGTVVSARFATLHELDTVYGLEDVFDMLEVISIDAHNKQVMNETRE